MPGGPRGHILTIMVISLSVAEAKAHLAQRIREAERGDRLVITRHGHPVAALVSVRDLDLVQRAGPGGTSGGLASLAGSVSRASTFVSATEAVKRGRSPGRKLPSLG